MTRECSNFEIREYFWAKTSVYVLLVYVVWPLEGISNSQTFLSQKSLLKMPILYGKSGFCLLFFPPMYIHTKVTPMKLLWSWVHTILNFKAYKTVFILMKGYVILLYSAGVDKTTLCLSSKGEKQVQRIFR